MSLSPARVLTRNRMGWVSAAISELSQAWVDDCRERAGLPALDIGAAFSSASLAALDAGISLIANDLDPGHLAELERRAGSAARLTLKPGRFPRDLHFEERSLHSVHISNVVHFLTGKQLDLGLRLIARWLRPGGRLYLQAVTPFQAIFTGFLPEYERRRQAGVRWPGYIPKLSEFARHRQFSQMPRSVHLLDVEILSRAASDAGLEIERCWYFRRADQPREILLDGRESVGLIARVRAAAEL